MIGERLGPWTLEKELGRGGMGSVYLAVADPAPPGLPARAALKVLAPELAADPGLRQRFQREIDILRRLRHPNIVRFLAADVERGRSYFAMEYVEGPSYQDLLDQRGRLPWPEVLDAALQLAPALKHAHDRGVIHRDLKPSNLLRAQPGEPGRPPLVKLTDFGIASLFAGGPLTAPGGIVGTAEYLSPEQAAGKPVTRRSDLYALGAVLYTLLTGRTPFEGGAAELLHKHLYGRFERPSRLVPDIPTDFEEIVCQLLEKEPARRPADGAILQRQLDRLRRKEERKASAATKPALGAARPARGAEPNEETEAGASRGPFNRLWVLLPLFLATLGLLVWSFWPPDAETLYQRAHAQILSANPDDWDKGRDALEQLKRRYPGAHAADLGELEQKLAEYDAKRDSEKKARGAGPMTEAQWFYQEGLRLRQEGKEREAREVWEALKAAFKDVPSEDAWVRLADEQLRPREDAKPPERDWGPVRAALLRARRLRADGKADDADKLERGLEQLYKGDKEFEALRKKVGAE
jgi:hypothetical protein